MQGLSDPECSQPRPQWGAYDLLALFSLFLLEIYASIKSFREVWLEIPERLHTNTFPGNAPPENIVKTTPMTPSGLDAPLIS